MNKPVKIFSIAFFVFICCLCFSALASAETVTINNQKVEVLTNGDYKYAIQNNEAYIVKYTGNESEISTPTSFSGKTVVCILDEAFYYNDTIQSVTVNAGVKTIGNYAFSRCSGLIKVLISKTIESIGADAFSDSTSLESVTFQKGSALKTIGDSCFRNDKSLVSVSIPSGTTTVGGLAFSNCQSLTEIEIPDSVTNAGPGVFYCCSDLEKVTIGNGLTALSTYYKWWGDFRNWGSDDDYNGFFEGCVSLTEIIFGSRITSIGQDCFAGTALTEFIIPDSVITIGDGAFMSCQNLCKLIIGDGVTSIGNMLCNNDDALESITIGKGVISIGEGMLFDCDAITEISIPSNVTSVGGGMCYGCDKLKKVTIGNGLSALSTYCERYGHFQDWGSDDDYHGFFEGCVSLTELIFGSGITSIGQDCFAGTALTELIIPDSVITIGDGAFMSCQNLCKLVIGDGVTSIGKMLCYNDDALESITIGKGVISIGERMLFDCDALTELTIPSNVTSVGGGMCFGCDKLKKVTIGNGLTALSTYHKWNERNWGSDDDYQGFFEGCVELSTVTVGNGLISVEEDCFAGTKVEKLEFPSRIHTFGKYSFTNANSLKDIYFAGAYPLSVDGNAYARTPEGLTLHKIKNKSGYDSLSLSVNEYTPVVISFDINSEDVFCSPTESQYRAPDGGYVVEPSNPIAVGYRFCGWYKDAATTEKWDFANDIATKNTTLYAKWKQVDEIAPLRPQNIKAENVGDSSANIKWDAVEGANSYNIYVNGVKFNSAPVEATSATVNKLTPTSTYEFSIEAVNRAGTSEMSFVLVIHTKEQTYTPGDVDNVDGITVSDARLALRCAIGLEKYAQDSNEFRACDVDGNGKVEVSDARLILRVSIGLDSADSWK